MTGHVYIMASRKNGTLYIGVTSDLGRRVHEHKDGMVKGFTKEYGVKRLVWYEEYIDIRDAIIREKAMKKWPRQKMKKWPRQKKIDLIEAANPDWQDLYRGMGW